MKGRIWTVPNQITFLRLGFLPVFLILIAYDRYRWALLVFVISGLSDGFDGLLARSLNQRSALGAYLDPIADKTIGKAGDDKNQERPTETIVGNENQKHRQKAEAQKRDLIGNRPDA